MKINQLITRIDKGKNKMNIEIIDINNNIQKYNKKPSDDEITIIYKILEVYNAKKVFGGYFVENNKNKCKIIYEDKEYKLEQYFELKNNKNKDTLEIKLKGIKNVTDMRGMFTRCSTLLSVPDISNWNTSNVTNMSGMFND